MTLIVWSGGADSTLVLVNRLLERATECREETIRTISFNVGQIDTSDQQRRSRLAIAARLGSLGLTWDDHTELRISTEEGDGLGHHGNPQATLWLLSMQALDKDEHLLMGYIRGDDFMVSSGVYCGVFSSMQANAERTGQIVYPLVNDTKRDVLAKILDYDLHDLIWWCQRGRKAGGEDPSTGPCGECASCVRHETALWQIKRWPPKPG